MIPFELDIRVDSGFGQKALDPLGKTEGERAHGEIVASSPEDEARSSHVRLCFQDQDSLAMAGQLCRGEETSWPGPDHQDIVEHRIPAPLQKEP